MKDIELKDAKYSFSRDTPGRVFLSAFCGRAEHCSSAKRHRFNSGRVIPVVPTALHYDEVSVQTEVLGWKSGNHRVF